MKNDKRWFFDTQFVKHHAWPTASAISAV